LKSTSGEGEKTGPAPNLAVGVGRARPLPGGKIFQVGAANVRERLGG